MRQGSRDRSLVSREANERSCRQSSSCRARVLTGIATGGDLSPRAFAVAFEATVELPSPIRDVVLGSLMTAMMVRGPVAADVVALLRSALVVDMRGAAKEINGR